MEFPNAVGNIQIPDVKKGRFKETVESFFANEESSENLLTAIHEIAAERHEFLIAARRNIHRHPELMYNEKKTSAFVQNVLKAMDISFTTGWGVNTHPDRIPGKGGFGVVADIGTGGSPCVLLRADMDALPIFEKTEGIDDFKSVNDGVMHACGHDGHVAMLLGAASVLKEFESSIKGTIRLIFQPAEEGGAGAKRMVEEGVLLKEPKPIQAFTLHSFPTLPTGVIASCAGTIKAAAERFEVVISGVGGHAAYPHLVVDPIVAASSIVMNLQTLVSRSLSPLESGVCSITKFEGGTAYNVIPGTITLRGTIRALSNDTLLVLKERVEHVMKNTAETHGCETSITYSADYYPPTINDEELYASFSKEVGALLSNTGELVEVDPAMGAEDFGFIAEKIPSTYFLLGMGSGISPPTCCGLHNSKFALDESVLPRGVELHVNLALRALKRLSEENEEIASDDKVEIQ